MRCSDSRIFTTHAGSLARNQLSALLIRQDHGKPVDPAALDTAIRARTRHVVERQLESGIDIVGDGEQARAGYSTYPAQRMSGFGGSSTRNDLLDFEKFPLYAEAYREAFRTNPEERTRIVNAPQAIAEVSYDSGCAGVRAECDAFDDALAGQDQSFAETFVTAASPGCVLTIMHNAHYASDRDYLFALARELKTEYEFIVSRGHLLQIDAPDLAMERYLYFRDASDAAFLASVEDHVEALNMALADVPRERVRLHVCWGTWTGRMPTTRPSPRCCRLYEARVGALNIPFANPGHQHEYETVRRNPPPDSMVLIPGVIDNMTKHLEHPQVVAERIQRAVDAVGERERVIAGVDCGFAVFTDNAMMTEDICWAKFRALPPGRPRQQPALGLGRDSVLRPYVGFSTPFRAPSWRGQIQASSVSMSRRSSAVRPGAPAKRGASPPLVSSRAKASAFTRTWALSRISPSRLCARTSSLSSEG